MTLYAVARIKARNLDKQTKVERIRLAIEAIKEAVSDINEFEAVRQRE